MTALRGIAHVVAVAAALACHAARAQESTKPPLPAGTAATPAPAAEEGAKAWSFYASAYGYFVPDGDEFVSSVVMADRGWLHLEARYNYENLRTASIWFGANFSAGEKLVLDFTAMAGVVMGNTAGIAPGYRFTLKYGKLELASESEYVFDSRDSADSFLYTWSELSVSATDWLRAGVVVQRTRLYGEDRDVQRGFLVGFSYEKVDLTGYLFNPDASKPTFVLALGLTF